MVFSQKQLIKDTGKRGADIGFDKKEIEAILTPAEVDTIERFIRDMSGFDKIQRCYLYGSRSRSNSHASSDLDIAVFVDARGDISEINHAIERWIEANEYIAGFHPVVVDTQTLENTFFGKNVKGGRLLWSRQKKIPGKSSRNTWKLSGER